MKALQIPRILGVGTDITSVERMLMIIKRGGTFEERFIHRCLHQKEIEEYRNIGSDEEDKKRAAQYIASRWAFKEAMVKATGNTSLYYPGMYLKKDL